MKKLFLLLMMPLLAIPFYSCSSDDDDDFPNGKAKLLKEIIYDDEEKQIFEYDSEQRLIKVTDKYVNETRIITITYGSNAITCKEGSSEEIFTLDNEGYVTKIVYKNGYKNGYYTEFKYADGYLSETKEYNNEGKLQNTYLYTWSNGNLIKIVDERYTTTYTYDNKENKLGFNDNAIVDYSDFIWLFKFKGMTNKNHQIGGSNDDWICTCEYTFDNDGYPTQLILKEGQYTDISTFTYY